MGQVVEAVNERIGKHVAIKILWPENETQQKALARFEAEARAAAAISHPGIIDIYDMGLTSNNAPFLVMEYLEGESLFDRMQDRGRLDVPFVAYIACHVLASLAAAHEKGLVHRDLKPENIFLVDQGRARVDAKLLDFGISLFVSGPGLLPSRLTTIGTVLGTPLYMSPEQARGLLDLDQRVDLWALGVILYECLTGRVPFEGEHYNKVLAKIITESFPSPRELRPDLPEALEWAIMSALQKDRGQRVQSAQEMMARLMPFADREGLIQIAMPAELRHSLGQSAIEPQPFSELEDSGLFDPPTLREDLSGAYPSPRESGSGEDAERTTDPSSPEVPYPLGEQGALGVAMTVPMAAMSPEQIGAASWSPGGPGLVGAPPRSGQRQWLPLAVIAVILFGLLAGGVAGLLLCYG